MDIVFESPRKFPIPENPGATSTAAPPTIDTSALAGEVPGVDESRTVGRAKDLAHGIVAIVWAADLVIAGAAVLGALTFRSWQRGELDPFYAALQNPLSPEALWVASGGVLFSWLMVLMKTYEVSNLYRMDFWVRSLAKSLVIWLIVSLAAVGLLQMRGFVPRVGLFYCVAAIGVTQILWRLFAFVFLMHPAIRESACQRTILVGWNNQAAQLRRAMRREVGRLAEIVGCVPNPSGFFAERPPREVAVLGEYGDLPKLVRQCEADAVILADTTYSTTEIEQLITFCQREFLRFQMVPDFFPALRSGLQIENVNGVQLLGITRLPLDRPFNRIIKRAIDIVGGAVGLVVAAPIIAFFATLVYFESPGPVIYRQRRASRCGRNFDIFKIRSMRLDAEATTGAVWCKQDDPRRLRIGVFMRQWNIDELPQFWNVLIGNMSLVGPRPERPELIERFKDEIPSYNARHEVKAGLTGWAQIHGFRGDTDLRKRIEHDLYYLENWSPALDLYCVLATFFKTKNAH